MKANGTLKTKGMIQNDEFFTKRTTVITQCYPLRKYLKNKKIICPCDDKNSEYYKILHDEWKLDVSLAPPGNGRRHDMFSVDYKKFDIVITNPPFSKINEFFSLLIENGCKFSILCPWLFIGNKFFLKNMINNSYWSASFSTDWKNSKKHVCCRFHTNISDLYKKTRKISHWQEKSATSTI